VLSKGTLEEQIFIGLNLLALREEGSKNDSPGYAKAF
jgi:hypothetical protein